MVTIISEIHCIKYRNFTSFPGVGILWEGTVSAEFLGNRPKLFGNCAFLQNVHTRKLVEISVFYTVIAEEIATPYLINNEVPLVA